MEGRSIGHIAMSADDAKAVCGLRYLPAADQQIGTFIGYPLWVRADVEDGEPVVVAKPTYAEALAALSAPPPDAVEGDAPTT